MTTIIHKDHRKGLPEPHAYPKHVAAILAERRPSSRRWLVWALAVVAFAALWLAPVWVLGLILGAIFCLLAWFLWAIRHDAKEYNQEHDLP
jgi:hypothetical protein